MIDDAAAKLRAFIREGRVPEVPLQRLVLQLTGRISDADVQSVLNKQLNAALHQLVLEGTSKQTKSTTILKAFVELDRVLAASGDDTSK